MEKRAPRSKWIALAVGMAAMAMCFLAAFVRAGSVEHWLAQRLEQVANHYLAPRLHIERLRYVPPRTAEVWGLWLEANDPVNGGKVKVVEVQHARLELAEVPSKGQPLRIKGIDLDEPVFRFVQPGKGEKLVGFGKMMRDRGGGGSGGEEKAAPRPSDVFEIRSINIHNGVLEFDGRPMGKPLMRLEGINSAMKVEPMEEEAGWYGLSMSAEREPLFDMSAQGRINVNSGMLEIEGLGARMELSEKTVEHLPGPVQGFVNAYQIAGKMGLFVKGFVPLHSAGECDLATTVTLAEGHVQIKECSVPVEVLEGQLEVHDKRVDVQWMRVRMLGGTIEGMGRVPFDPSGSMSVDVRVRDVHLARTIRTFSQNDKRPTVAGLVDGQLMFSAPRGTWKSAMTGSGDFSLRHGRLPDLPVLGDILKGLQTVTNLGQLAEDDREGSARLVFEVKGDHLDVTQLDARTSRMLMRGSGRVWLDGRLDLRVNAGPLEMLERALGPVGKGIGAMTDTMGGYRVGGTLKKPEVGVEVGPE